MTNSRSLYLVSIFVLNTFVYKRLHASGRTFPIRSRIVIGMISATLAMCMAGVVEIFRQKTCLSSPTISQTIGRFLSHLSLFCRTCTILFRQDQLHCRGHDYLLSVSSVHWNRSVRSLHVRRQSRICLHGCAPFCSVIDHESTILFGWLILVFRFFLRGNVCQFQARIHL